MVADADGSPSAYFLSYDIKQKDWNTTQNPCQRLNWALSESASLCIYVNNCPKR